MKDLKIEIPDGFILDEEKYKNNTIAFLPKPIDPQLICLKVGKN